MVLPAFLRIPSGMMGRIVMVLAGAILLELLGNLLLHRWQDRELLDSSRAQIIAQQLLNAVHVAEAAAPPDRARLMHSLNMEGLALNWVPSTVIVDHSAAQEQLASMRRWLVQAAPELDGRELRLSLLPAHDGQQRDLVGLMALRDGSFISFRISSYLRAPPPLWFVSLLHVLLLVIVFGLALIMIRNLIRPLRDLAAAADETGRHHVYRIVPAGPLEVRRLARAFDAMQTRLIKAMDDNTQALIVVSHDLRTPIQRMKLRASMLEDTDTGEMIAHDLSEMEDFIDSTLAYVRSGKDEQPRLIDVAAMLITIADEASDRGVNVQYIGPGSFVLHTRPLALTRMVQNLMENARRYAERIEIHLLGEESHYAQIQVEDDGPGIPQAKWAEVVQPFRKLEASQAIRRDGPSAKQGAGLGLAFIQRTLHEQSGSLTLGTSALGGLRASIHIPDSRAAEQ
ncbi:hypothetical protein MB02_16300 [Croceicoccus estronivorus]|uniref:ATP-binding protein n=1 Tax=Croceicoccus estronivorus TaxID=1172626 RepID=UPI000829C7D9|nr:ATP-binding protein [Croceicoccus estronivorus]OCC22572.1 hypothetical protein MB02_16300 [Croceicoccus estronivorus]